MSGQDEDTREEFEYYQASYSATGKRQLGGASGHHDDRVTAIALALWKATKLLSWQDRYGGLNITPVLLPSASK